MTTLCLKIKSDRAEGDGFIQMNGSENINIPFLVNTSIPISYYYTKSGQSINQSANIKFELAVMPEVAGATISNKQTYYVSLSDSASPDKFIKVADMIISDGSISFSNVANYVDGLGQVTLQSCDSASSSLTDSPLHLSIKANKVEVDTVSIEAITESLKNRIVKLS